MDDKKFKLVLTNIADGLSLKKACKSAKTTTDTFYLHIDEEGESERKVQYTRARNHRGDTEIDRLDEIEDQLRKKEIDPPTARILSDNCKWRACKFYPKMYGDRTQMEITGANGGAVKLTTDINITFDDVEQVVFSTK